MIRLIAIISLLLSAVPVYSQAKIHNIKAIKHKNVKPTPCSTSRIERTPTLFGFQLGMRAVQTVKNVPLVIDQKLSTSTGKNINLKATNFKRNSNFFDAEVVTAYKTFSNNRLSEARFVWRTSEKWLNIDEFSRAVTDKLKLPYEWTTEASDSKFAESILNLDENLKFLQAELELLRSKYSGDSSVVKRQKQIISDAAEYRERQLSELKYERHLQCRRFDLYISLIETDLAMIHIVRANNVYPPPKKSPYKNRIIY